MSFQLRITAPSTSEVPRTRCSCRLKLALAFLSPFRLIVVGRVEVDGTEKFQDLEPLAMRDVFGKRRRDRLFLGLVMTDLAGGFNQLVINGEIGWHCLHIYLCKK